MSRRIGEDAKELYNFFENYSLASPLNNPDFKQKCFSLHKRLYALMIFCHEKDIRQSGINEQVFIQYLKETVSDLLASILNWAQGSYKTAKLSLRCSIEDMVKACLSIDDSSILAEKSVFEIFEKANSDKHFTSTVTKKYLDELHNKYAVLCGTVHSDPRLVDPIISLSYLPQYNEGQAEEYVTIYNSVVSLMLCVLYFNYYDEVHMMHPENVQDFLEAIAKREKQKISNELFE